ncbi:MAG TPA: family 1 glycosylhydrolase, partial [Propionibacteriaceae bacterium]|nr:family 1 glycosylhydrolase [Propionibacteriaceae bacterium]
MVDASRLDRLWQQIVEINRAQQPELDAMLDRLTSPVGAATLADIARFLEVLTAARSTDLPLSGAQAIVDLLEKHPGFRDGRELTVGLPVFADRDRQWADLQADAARTLVQVDLAVLLVAERTERHVEVLMHVAAGADTFSTLLREVLLGRPVPDLDWLTRRPPLLVDLAELSVRGCMLGVRHAFNALAQSASYAKEAAKAALLQRTWATGITALTPSVGCAGTLVTIAGSGFGATQPAQTSVRFPRRGGGCTEARVAPGGWSATAIKAIAPLDVGDGCVGFTWTPDPPLRPAGVAMLAEAVYSAAGEMETCIGLPAMRAAQLLRDRGATLFAVRQSCPECLPGEVNRFRGGRPIIRSFTASASQLLSGDPLDLSWRVENATSVEIRTRRVNGRRHELPDVPASLNSAQGTYHVANIPGTWLWRAEYELRAMNQCASPADPETARVEVSMRIRRPADFLWGTATAGYQVEGGITNNDWHFFTTNPSIVQRVHDLGAFRNFVLNLVPAGEAVQHGRPIIAMTDAMRGRLIGMNAYRFSVEWSRVEPTRLAFDTAALDYYASLADSLIQQGIEPIVTLSHMTLPLWVLQPPTKSKGTFPGFPDVADGTDPGFQASLRGWENPVTVDEWVGFVRRVVDRLAAVGVRYWNTLNEPVGSVIGVGYIAGVWPPGFSLEGARAKLAYGNLLRAHVRAYLAIKALDPGARVGLAHQMAHYKPSPV